MAVERTRAEVARIITDFVDDTGSDFDLLRSRWRLCLRLPWVLVFIYGETHWLPDRQMAYMAAFTAG